MKPPRRSRVTIADGVSWFTRTQAARFLGITPTAIKRAEKRGALSSVTFGEAHVFARTTLELYRARSGNGEIASKVFRALDEGMDPTALVSALELSPDVVDSLIERYQRLSGAWLVAGPPGSRTTWQRTYGLQSITPLMLRRALELVSRTPSLRAKLLDGL